MRPRLDAPAFSSFDIDILVTAVALNRSRSLHAHLHKIDSPFGAFRSGRYFVIEHEMTPVGPHEFGLASTRTSTDEFCEGVPAFCQGASARGKTSVRVLVDENAVRGEDIGVVITI